MSIFFVIWFKYFTPGIIFVTILFSGIDIDNRYQFSDDRDVVCSTRNDRLIDLES